MNNTDFQNLKAAFLRQMENAKSADRLSPRTVEARIQTMRRFESAVGNFEIPRVGEFLREIESANVTRNLLFDLKSFAKFVVGADVGPIPLKWATHILSMNSVQCQVGKQNTKALTWSEFLTARSYFKTEHSGRYLFAFDLAAATGVRISELASLDPATVEFIGTKFAYIHVVQKRSRNSKFGVFRRVPVLDLFLVQEFRRMRGLPFERNKELQFSVVRQFLELQKVGIQETGIIPHLFDRDLYQVKNRKNQPGVIADKSTLSIAAWKVQQKKGIRFTFHRLRSTFISLLVVRGLTNPVVNEYYSLEPGTEKPIKVFRRWVGHEGRNGHTKFNGYCDFESLRDWPLG